MWNHLYQAIHKLRNEGCSATVEFSLYPTQYGSVTILNEIWARLVHEIKQQFLVFKQHYTYFFTFFHPHVFLKNTNNVTRTTLPNGLRISKS